MGVFAAHTCCLVLDIFWACRNAKILRLRRIGSPVSACWQLSGHVATPARKTNGPWIGLKSSSTPTLLLQVGAVAFLASESARLFSQRRPCTDDAETRDEPGLVQKHMLRFCVG